MSQSNFKLQLKLSSESLNKGRIGIAFVAPHLVINMRDDWLDVWTMLHEQSKQRHAVSSAAHADDPRAGFDRIEMFTRGFHG